MDDLFEEGEPELLASAHATMNEWEMRSGGKTYRVIATIPSTSDDTCYVMVDVTRSWMEVGQTSNCEVRTWAKMRGDKTGGIITSEFVEKRFQLDPVTAERVALLIASALGRPYAVRYSESLQMTPD